MAMINRRAALKAAAGVAVTVAAPAGTASSADVSMPKIKGPNLSPKARKGPFTALP